LNLLKEGPEDFMRTVKASEFEARCLQLMDEVTQSGESLVITKRGKPVSVLSPYPDRSSSLFGRHRDSVKIHGDIVRSCAAHGTATERETVEVALDMIAFRQELLDGIQELSGLQIDPLR
jgi:prevent-host-death family protein